MSPDSSATGMNCAGGMSCSPAGQRARASRPRSAPVLRSTIGWKNVRSRRCSIAWRRWVSSDMRSTTRWCMLWSKTAQRPPPRPLASYMAMSALRSRTSGATIPSRLWAIPMLPTICSARRSNGTGWAMVSHRRVADLQRLGR